MGAGQSSPDAVQQQTVQQQVSPPNLASSEGSTEQQQRSSVPRTRQQMHSMQMPQQQQWQMPMMQRSSIDYSTFNDDDELVAPAAAAHAAGGAACATAQPESEINFSGPVSISTRVEYTALPCGQAQDVFGIVTAQAAAEAAEKKAGSEEPRQPMDIICVLDVSGSMMGDKIRLVQEAVRFVIKESEPKDRLSIVAFNHGATRVLRLARMHNEGKNEATVATSRLQAQGGTCITSGLEAAMEIAERRKHRNPVSAIFLLTDGQDGSRGGSYVPLITRAQHAGCSLYCFGFGADHDARLLAEIAEQAQTPFTFVEDVDSIGAAFAGAMGGLASVVAQRVELTFNCNVTLKAVHTPFPKTTTGSQTTIQIPDMLAGERRDVLVEVSIPAKAGGSTDMVLLTASAKYFDLAAGTPGQTPNAEMHLLRTEADEPQPEMEPDEEVARQRDRVEVAQTLETATAHGEAGEFAKAQELLSAHEGRLRGKRKTAVSEALAVELQDARERMASRSSWEDGGMAQVRERAHMHSCQRTTNVTISSKSRADNMSKGMYATSVQQSWMSKVKR